METIDDKSGDKGFFLFENLLINLTDFAKV